MKLADIIDTFISGDWGEESPTQDTPNAAYCVRGADIVPITNHNFTDIPQRYVCDRTKETKLLAAGDLVIEKSGGSPTQSTGRIVYVSEDLIKAKGNVVCSNFCTAFRVKAGWNPLYVYYFWQNVYNHGAFFNFEGKTSGIKNLQLDNALSAIDIEYLPLEKQNQIVASLASIDEKIKVNRQINDNLEEQAKALFNHYFIQNTENLGEWQDGVLTDIAQYLNGLAMQKYPAMPNEAGLPVLKIKELGQGQCDTNSDRCSSLIKPEYIISDGTIIFSWSGTLLVDIWCGGKCGLNQHLFKVSSAKYPQWFVFYWTKHHLNKFIRIAKDKAVTMGHIKRCDLEISKVKIPSKQALVNLDKLFSPIFNRMVTCRIENRKLSSLRDTLLPKLMSGEISVEEVSLD